MIEIIGKPDFECPDDIKWIVEISFLENVKRMEIGDRCVPLCGIEVIKPNQEHNDLKIIPFEYPNDLERRKMQALIYAEAVTNPVDFIFYVVDMWMVSSDDPEYSTKNQPRDDPDRKESLNGIITRYDGKVGVILAFYSRTKDNKCVFPDMVKWNTPIMMSNGFFIKPWRAADPTKH